MSERLDESADVRDALLAVCRQYVGIERHAHRLADALLASGLVPPASRVVTEYVLVHVHHGVPVPATRPSERDRWSETITLSEAGERWYDGAVPATRERTTYDERLTPWQVVTPPGLTGGDGA